MIYTSYFGNLKNLPKNITPISICAKVPEWYKGLQYKKLAPKYQTLMTWKADHDDEKYIESYTRTVLNQLVSDNVITELSAHYDAPEYWADDGTKRLSEMEAAKDEFFQLFSEHFYALWD